MKVHLTGDICRPGVVALEVEALKYLPDLGEMLAFSDHELEIVDEQHGLKIAGFIPDGDVKNEMGEDLGLPPFDPEEKKPPQITKGGDPDGNDYEVPEALAKEGFWLTVGKAAVLIKNGDDGVSVAMYSLGGEADDALSEAWVTHGELEAERVERALETVDDIEIEKELEKLQGVCEQLTEILEKEGNHDAAFYHKVLGQHIENAVRYTKGR